MRRRRFLEGCGLGLAGLLTATGRQSLARASGRFPLEIKADIAIIGGGLGGCAAALAVLRMGKTVVMTEPTDWIGGQLTSQAVPPDEHPWIESFGANASYMALRKGIREYYRRNYPLTAEAGRNWTSGTAEYSCCAQSWSTTSIPGRLSPSTGPAAFPSTGALNEDHLRP